MAAVGSGEVTAGRGDNVTFNCSGSGGPDNSYRWQINDTFFSAKSSLLHLILVDATSGGKYTCLVTNRVGNSNTSVTLYIEPYFTTYPARHLEVELSDTVTLTCDAEGFPTPEIKWIKVTGNINNGSTISVAGILKFQSITAEDDGTYICQATAQNSRLRTAIAPASKLIGKLANGT